MKRRKDERQYLIDETTMQNMLEHANKAGQRDRFPPNISPGIGDTFWDASTSTLWRFATNEFPFWEHASTNYTVVFEPPKPGLKGGETK